MKKWILIFAGVVLLTAAAIELTEQLLIEPKTISSWSELADCYYAARTGIPPIPSPVPYIDVVGMMNTEDWSFLSGFWSFNHSGGTLYIAEESQLAKKLKLPMQIMVYEDLQRNEVVIIGSADGKTYKGLALFDAPEWMPYEDGFPLEKYLLDELGPRRVVWSVTLKSEADGWNDLLNVQEQTLSAPMMMTMSAPETITDFRIIQDGTNLSVNLPAEFVGATITLHSCSNLVDGVWTNVLQTNAASSGIMSLGYAEIPSLIYQTNVSSGWVDCPDCATTPGAVCTNQTFVTSTNQVAVGGGLIYFKTTASSTIDADGDQLKNLDEYERGTDYLDSDSDGDGLPDGYEVSNGLNPLSSSDGGIDSDSDGLVNSNEYANRTDPFNDDVTAPFVSASPKGNGTFYLP